MTNTKSIKPEQIRIRDRILLVCSHGECMENRIWDFDTCWEHLTNTEKLILRERLVTSLRSGADLSGIILSGANLAGFDFTRVNLSKSFLNQCNLSSCRFVDTDLRYAFLEGANLQNADMSRAELNGTVFTSANLNNSTLLGYSLKYGRIPVNLEMRNFGKEALLQRPHINEKEPRFAERTYRALKSYFSSEGDYDSASWASYCERLMQSRVLWQTKKYLQWFVTWLFGVLSGYGEKPVRSVVASLAIIFMYAIVYKIFRLIVPVGGLNPISWIDSLYFSFATFCGYTFADLVPLADPVGRLIVVTESFAGIFALGLFVFTLTKRYVAR